MSAKLGEILVRENLISPQSLRETLDYQREHGGRLGFNLVKLGFVSDDMITAVLSRHYGIPSVNLELFNIDPGVLRLIPQDVAQKHSVLSACFISDCIWQRICWAPSYPLRSMRTLRSLRWRYSRERSVRG